MCREVRDLSDLRSRLGWRGGHPEYGSTPNKVGEAEWLCTKILKRGPALGITLILSTQRPDKASLPTQISANVGLRFCLRVMGQVENDMVLGTSMYQNGYRATTFREIDKGIGYLVGETDPQVVRTAYLDGPAAEKICARARSLRESAGRLTGHALGEQPAAASSASVLTVLDDVAAVLGGQDKIWSEVLLERLADHRPDVYDGWGADSLAAALKPHGVTPRQVWGTTADGRGANRRGYDRADVTAAITRRDQRRDAG